MSSLLLAQNELRGDEIDDEKSREHQYVGPKLLEAKRLGEGADADRLVPRRGKPKPNNRPPPDNDETGTNSPEKFTAGMIDRMEVAKTAVTCVRVKVEISCPNAVVAPT